MEITIDFNKLIDEELHKLMHKTGYAQERKEYLKSIGDEDYI